MSYSSLTTRYKALSLRSYFLAEQGRGEAPRKCTFPRFCGRISKTKGAQTVCAYAETLLKLTHEIVNT